MGSSVPRFCSYQNCAIVDGSRTRVPGVRPCIIFNFRCSLRYCCIALAFHCINRDNNSSGILGVTSTCQMAWKMGIPNHHVRDMKCIRTTNLSAPVRPKTRNRPMTRINFGGAVPRITRICLLSVTKRLQEIRGVCLRRVVIFQ